MYTDAYISIKSFFRKIGRDRIYTFSATSAFFIILSIFPFLILLLSVVQFTPLTEEMVISRIHTVLPDIIAPLISGIFQEIYNTNAGTVLVITSAAACIWSASKGVLALVRGINICFNVNDRRSYIIIRLLSCLYTFVLFLMLVFLMVLMVFGSTIFNAVKPYLGNFVNIIEAIVSKRWFITVPVITLVNMLIYSVFPARKKRFLRMFPGALLAAFGWTLLSWAASIYVKYFPNFTYTYGSLTSFILLMMWLYFGMYITFVCAEFNFFADIWFNKLANRRKTNKAEKYEAKLETKEIRSEKIKKFLNNNRNDDSK